MINKNHDSIGMCDVGGCTYVRIVMLFDSNINLDRHVHQHENIYAAQQKRLVS